MVTQQMLITFLILIIATFLFIQGKYRSELIAIGSLLLLAIFGILTPEEALSGFSNPVVIMIAGLSIVGAGIFDSGLAKKIGNALLRHDGTSEKKLLFHIMLIVSLCSAVLSSSGTVSVLLPVITSVAFQLHMNPSRFLLPLAFASSIGGLLTLIGTPFNLIISDALGKAGFERLAFFDITGVGLVAVFAGMLFMVTIGQRLLPRYEHPSTPHSVEKSMSPGELAGLYKVYDQLHFIHVPETSEIVGERLADLKLPLNYAITVIEIERKVKEKLTLKHSKHIIAKASEIIHPNDLLLVFGGTEQVNHFVRKYELEQKPFDLSDMKAHFLRRTYGLTEILVAPHSSLEDQTIMDIHFREKYNCNVLAINHKGEYDLSDLANKKLKLGDALLVHGKWENIELISKDKHDVVVLGSMDEDKVLPIRERKATIAAIIMGLMLFLMIFNIVSPAISILIAVFLMIVTRCIPSIEEAYNRINWESVILLAVMIPLATALQKTGGIQFLSNQFLALFGDLGGIVILICVYLLTATLAQFINQIAVTVILAPIAVTVAVDAGISPYPLLICITAAVSMAFTTPVSSPANALVVTAGGYSYKDFVRVGLPLQMFVGACVIAAIALFFPF